MKQILLCLFHNYMCYLIVMMLPVLNYSVENKDKGKTLNDKVCVCVCVLLYAYIVCGDLIYRPGK